MPVCRTQDININYRIYGSGTPLVLVHSFTSSLEMWSSLARNLPPKYRIIVYDVRGHGLSSAPCGAENYSLDILVEDLHNLLVHLKVKKAIVGGLSLGGAIALGYAHRHPEVVEALLIFDIHGGFQPFPDAEHRAAMDKVWEEEQRYAIERGTADLARLKIQNKTAFLPDFQDEVIRESYIEQMSRCPINGFIGIGRAKPWEAEWQRQAADAINIPALITVGGSDPIKPGVKALHAHIKDSRYVEIEGAIHGTAQWCPEAFNKSVIEFLDALEKGSPIAGEISLDRNGNQL